MPVTSRGDSLGDDLHEARLRRVTENEELFRAANEAHDAVVGDAPRPVAYFCECAEVSCVARVSLPSERYREIHEHPLQFVILPGHELAEFETVVEEGDGYAVVRKDS
jgi:hypothetical protein